MNKLAATLAFVTIMTASHGWDHNRAVEEGSNLIVDMDCTLSEAILLSTMV